MEFKQIAPFWSEKLEQDVLNGLEIFTVLNHRLDMREWCGCIVGEAWGFKSDYIEPLSSCCTCKDLATLFFHALVKMRLGRNPEEKSEGESDFYKLRNFFTLHWNEKHLKQNEA